MFAINIITLSLGLSLISGMPLFYFYIIIGVIIWILACMYGIYKNSIPSKQITAKKIIKPITITYIPCSQCGSITIRKKIRYIIHGKWMESQETVPIEVPNVYAYICNSCQHINLDDTAKSYVLNTVCRAINTHIETAEELDLTWVDKNN